MCVCVYGCVCVCVCVWKREQEQEQKRGRERKREWIDFLGMDTSPHQSRRLCSNNSPSGVRGAAPCICWVLCAHTLGGLHARLGPRSTEPFPGCSPLGTKTRCWIPQAVFVPYGASLQWAQRITGMQGVEGNRLNLTPRLLPLLVLLLSCLQARGCVSSTNILETRLI